jgi:hypothetical protein
MKFIHIILIVLNIFLSCTSYDEMLDALETKQAIEKLKIGMSILEVDNIAGKPFKKKFTQDSTEVWIYITGIPQTAFSQSYKDLENEYKTAIIFENKKLKGWGEKYISFLN